MSTILVAGNYVVGPGQTVNFGAENPAYGVAQPNILTATFTDRGSISVNSTDPSTFTEYAFGNIGTVTIDTGASLTVAATSTISQVWGYEDVVTPGSFTNNGTVSISGGAAAGGAFMVTGAFQNTGHFDVTGGSAEGAFGMTTFNNSGEISVQGVTRAIGVVVGSNNDPSITNSGSITATVSSGSSAYGIEVVSEYKSGEAVHIVNTGTISAVNAIASVSSLTPAMSESVDLSNSGTINGLVTLGPGPYLPFIFSYPITGSQIHNSGVINGAVHLSTYSNDLYDGRGGTQSGGIYLGAGNDTVYLGNDGETVHGGAGSAIVLGGSGADHFIGGAGNDIVDGGGGDDALDGGGGLNTVSYASAATGVAVSLALQGSAQNTVGAGYDTLSNFQSIVGSAHDDTLTGDAGDNTLRGGAGDDHLIGGLGSDYLVGGPGADVFVFTSLADSTASHPDLIGDFVHGVDKIDLHLIDPGLTWGGDTRTAHGVWVTTSGVVTVVHISDHGPADGYPVGYAGSDAGINLYGTNLGLTASDFIF